MEIGRDVLERRKTKDRYNGEKINGSSSLLEFLPEFFFFFVVQNNKS